MSELLPDTDLRALSAAMGARREFTLTRTLGGTTLTLCVRHAPAVWGVPMIVQVRVESRGIAWVQSFESVGEMRRGLG